MTFKQIALAAALSLTSVFPAGAASMTVSGPITFSNGGGFPGFGVEIFFEFNRDLVDVDPRATHSRFDSVVSSGFVAVDGLEVFRFDSPAFSTFNFVNLNAEDDAFDFSSIEWSVGDGGNFEITGGLGTDLAVFNNQDLSVFPRMIDLVDNPPIDIWFGNSGSVLIQSADLDFEYENGAISVSAVPLPAGLPLFVAALVALAATRFRKPSV